MGTMITYQKSNNPMYNAHKNMGARYTWERVYTATYISEITCIF